MQVVDALSTDKFIGKRTDSYKMIGQCDNCFEKSIIEFSKGYKKYTVRCPICLNNTLVPRELCKE